MKNEIIRYNLLINFIITGKGKTGQLYHRKEVQRIFSSIMINLFCTYHLNGQSGENVADVRVWGVSLGHN
jgi:hypothetical protein